MNKISPLLCVPLLAACGVAGAQDATAPATPVLPANALDAHAAAAAIEACSAKMQLLLAALDRHDYAGAEADFDDTMRASLSPGQLQQAWDSLPQKFGAPGLRGAAYNSVSSGYNVVTVPTPFQNASLAAQIACGADGKIVGFHVMTLAPSSPAAAGSAATPTPSGH